MKVKKLKLLLLCVVLLLFGFVGAAFGDWDEGDPHKMHYPQLPKEGGWDVALFSEGSIWLADDWQCSQTGLVSDIHFWVSWQYDDVQTINGFAVCIWSDDPCGPAGYSEPNELLWARNFSAGDITVRNMPDDLQGWFDPYWDEWDPCDHNKWSQVNIEDINEPFIQEEGKIYWLMIDVWDGGTVGWKESGSPHFRDDAVYYDGLKWYELRDPITGDSLDLAFVITTYESVVKWVQEPDLNDINGIDVDAVHWYSDLLGWQVLADDFECNTTGPITDIYIWGSWLDDELPPNGANDVEFWVEIFSDNPVGPNGWSVPDEQLRWWDFWPGDFDVWPYAQDLNEGYYSPYTGYYDPVSDTNCWLYHFHIDPCDAFIQQGDPCDPNVYWLVIQALPQTSDPNVRFGWKTSTDHHRDDAVWKEWWSGSSGPWIELRYPLGHPFAGQTIDLAFAITTGAPLEEPEYAKPLTPHTKWSQPPVEIDPNSAIPTYCGWDEHSWIFCPTPPTAIWPIVADDFRCLGTMPVTSIHWWGSYADHDENEPLGEAHEEWRIRFWSNVTAGMPVTFSWPEKLLWEIVIEDDRVQINKAGEDKSPKSTLYDDTCFQYYVELEPNEIFWQNDFNDQTMDDIYWMSIEALDYNTTCPAHWGWKTRPWHWMDDAVTLLVDVNTTVGTVVDPCTNNITPIAYDGNSFDVSFELDTDPNYIKWEQLYTGIRNWPHYEDELSMVTTRVKKWEQLPDPNRSGLHCHDSKNGGYSWITLADDWHCEGGLVTDLHWWGSYEKRGSGIDHFHLSIHEPNVNSPNLPGPEVWGVDVPFSSLTEIDTGLLLPPVPPGNPIYLYEYDLNEPFPQIEDMNYWFDITAYSIDPCDPNIALWYWQEAGRNPVYILNPAVAGGGPGGGWDPLDWGYGYSDMAFAITSRAEVNEPNHNLVADDWRCLRRTPVTAIAWWGSYIGYGYEACNRGFAPVPPYQFRLTMWTDSPAGSDPCYLYSHPDELIWEYNTAEYDEVLVGYDKHPLGAPNEPVFRYSVRLPEEEWFHQPDYNEVFWFSVQAVYDVNTSNYDWGWTNHEHVFNDKAVSGYYDDANEVWVWTELYDQTGASEDMSFILFTDPDECSTCANYNCDARVNFVDYADFADDWRWVGSAGGYNNSDLDCNGVVDFKDLGIFCMQWLDSCP